MGGLNLIGAFGDKNTGVPFFGYYWQGAKGWVEKKCKLMAQLSGHTNPFYPINAGV
jgi:hypothetical protein